MNLPSPSCLNVDGSVQCSAKKHQPGQDAEEPDNQASDTIRDAQLTAPLLLPCTNGDGHLLEEMRAMRQAGRFRSPGLTSRESVQHLQQCMPHGPSKQIATVDKDSNQQTRVLQS